MISPPSAILDPPRWKNGPCICTATNLPVHETRNQAMAFLKSIAMEDRLVRLWECPHCDCWHHECKSVDPSGGSSGTGRSSKKVKR
jgi:hypothetical protein